jgi:glucoamylase
MDRYFNSLKEDSLTSKFFVLNPKKSVFICVYLWLIFFCFTADAQTLAPGAPGKDAQWTTAGKQGVGTSVSLESKVWFTLAQGVITEVYYPDVTMANVQLLQFVVVNPKTKKVETERDDANHQIKVQRPDSLTFQQINTAKSGEWTIKKTYTTDIKKNTVLIDVRFENPNQELNLYVYFDPSVGNSGMRDTAHSGKDFLLASEAEKSVALVFTSKIEEATSGFYQVSDGLEQLRTSGKIVDQYKKAETGNVAQMAKILQPKQFTAVLSLASDFKKSFVKIDSSNIAVLQGYKSKSKGFAKCLAEYEAEWSAYVRTLPKVEAKYQAQFNMAAMQLKAHEDKINRGANIASLSIPWGGGDNANENTVAGYHLVWSRDLYQVATAFMALGDNAAAIRALDFLFKVQQKPDGSFPQNSFLDGKPFWGSLQLDEVAYPLILAYQLGRSDKATYANHVKKAADFIVKNGARTPQERWEEEAGFSPSTIAAEIAGLVCAAEIARKNGDEASATIYLATADDWARNVERWTATTTGKYGDGNYYLRITQNGEPDKGEKIELNNGAGFFDEREVVDAGFLELVRLGIKSPDDPLIAKSVKVIDQVIKVNTPNGEGFYRYNHDGYGEMDDGRRWNWDGKYTGKGRLWALLSGERGQYELARSDYAKNYEKFNSSVTRDEYINGWKVKAQTRLDAMLSFANKGLMIPEQIWDKAETPNVDRQFVPELEFGEGTGSATPLAWSMAQFIRLAVNLKANKNLETPDVVYNRYVKNEIPGQASNFGGTDEKAVVPVKAGETFRFTRRAAPNAKVAISYLGETKLLPINEKGEFTIEIVAPEKEETGIIAVEMPDGATAFERVKIHSINKIEAQKFSAETIEKIKNAATSPVIENNTAILFYRGEAKDVQIAGDLTDWNPGRLFMQDIEKNLKAFKIDLDSSARIEYKLVVDGKWITDELNPNRLDNGVGGENSVLTMPDYKPTDLDKEIKGFQPALETIEIKSKVFGESRKIQVFASPDSTAKHNRQPVLYFQDGTDYIKRGRAVEIYQNLLAAKKIKPFIMVFVDYKDRAKEYWATDEYAEFLATEVVPAIDAKFKTIKNRDGRAILGASLGGITSFWVGLKYPEVFSRIGGQSSSFWVDNERVVKKLMKLDAEKIAYRFYIDDGDLEGVDDSRRVNVLLRAKGFPVAYREEITGHNWTSWRDRLADAFIEIWAR